MFAGKGGTDAQVAMPCRLGADDRDGIRETAHGKLGGALGAQQLGAASGIRHTAHRGADVVRRIS